MTPKGMGRTPAGDVTIGGRVLVVPTDDAAQAPAGACAAALEDAGHLARVSIGLARAHDEAAAGGFEVIVIVLGAVARDKRPADLIGWVPDQTPVIVAGVADAALARELLMAGAYLTLEDPGRRAPLEGSVARALLLARALQREARFDPAQKDLARQIGSGDLMQPVLQRVELVASTNVPVLLIGEVGSGKQVIARALHSHPASPRRNGPFVKAPVSALSGMDPESIHAELFGAGDMPGLVARARSGTLFLDDIARLPGTLQTAVEDLIESSGEPGDPRAGVRLIAGSGHDLEEDVAAGRMRQELAHRLGVVPIRIPALRQRVDDIPILANALVERFAALAGGPILGLSPGAVRLLQQHAWPGNIRELEEHVERAVRRATGPCLDPADLAELAHRLTGQPVRERPRSREVAMWLDPSLPLTEVARRAAAAAEIVSIRNALQVTGGNVTHAARLLGVSRMHLQKRMKRYGLRE